jgi:hypothetical protein
MAQLLCCSPGRTEATRPIGPQRPRFPPRTNRIPTEAQPPAPPAASVRPLSVRIELNLPVSDKQEVYDNIFRSIRENLLTVNLTVNTADA